MIARAQLHDPQVLFLDEPTRGLDPIAAREVHTSIEQLSSNGKTILLPIHVLEEADQLCKRVAFMVNWHVVANDTPENLKLTHGKRSLNVTVSDPKDGNHLVHVSLKMDDPNDQRELGELMAQGNVR